MDWPNPLPSLGAIGDLSAIGPGSQAGEAVKSTGSGRSDQNMGTNVVVYMPIVVPIPVTLYGAVWVNGATVSGNVDAGLMDAEGNRLVNIGSTAQGASGIQTAAFGTPLTIPPGLYYIAMTQDNTTGLISMFQPAAQVLRAVGVQNQTTVAFGIPTTFTLANANPVSRIPMLSLSVNSVL